MSRSFGRPSEAGFSIVELLVTAMIMVAVMTIVLTSFDITSNVSQAQADVADLQQGMRIGPRDVARLVRMVGRGGLPRVQSVLVQQNVPDDTAIGAEQVLPGTDILTLRGVFSSPIFRVDAGDEATFQTSGDTATLLVDSVTSSGFAQSLDAFKELVDPDDGTSPEPIVLVGRQGDAVYAVVELANASFADTGVQIQGLDDTVERATLTLNISEGAGGHTGAYLPMSAGGTFPANLTSVLFAAVLEEYRFYIREDYGIPGDPTSILSPKLSRARMVPGTNTVHPGDAANGALDLADNIFDLQVALGIDLDGSGVVDTEDAGGNLLAEDADEWLWNHPNDDEGLAWNTSALRQVRLSLLGQTNTPDRQYVSPAIASIENRVYNEPESVSGSALAARRYRRRQMQTVVDLRNL